MYNNMFCKKVITANFSSRFLYKNQLTSVRTIITANFAKQPQLVKGEGVTEATISFSKDPKSIPVGAINLPKDIKNFTEVGLSHVELKVSNFKEDKIFKEILNDLIKNSVYNDFSYQIEAQVVPNSFMPIYDFRDIPAHGRTPAMENVFGYVCVDANGIMIKDSFEDNNTYRLFSGTDGIVKLSDFLYEKIKNKIKA
ncbi:unnamed protein product [[Candida] boidinii]|nr:unnamed protein product [[Candida] boidinii]